MLPTVLFLYSVWFYLAVFSAVGGVDVVYEYVLILHTCHVYEYSSLRILKQLRKHKDFKRLQKTINMQTFNERR